MTPALTAEQMRIAIAEACGWTKSDATHPDIQQIWIHPKTAESWSYVPDYLNCLNACAEMEKVLTSEQKCTYAYMLAEAVGFFSEDEDYHPLGCAFATALQRSRAFCQTLNLNKGE